MRPQNYGSAHLNLIISSWKDQKWRVLDDGYRVNNTEQFDYVRCNDTRGRDSTLNKALKGTRRLNDILYRLTFLCFNIENHKYFTRFFFPCANWSPFIIELSGKRIFEKPHMVYVCIILQYVLKYSQILTRARVCYALWMDLIILRSTI